MKILNILFPLVGNSFVGEVDDDALIFNLALISYLCKVLMDLGFAGRRVKLTK